MWGYTFPAGAGRLALECINFFHLLAFFGKVLQLGFKIREQFDFKDK